MSYWGLKHQQLLSKHPGGGHDQKSHGNWATGVTKQMHSFSIVSTSSASRAVQFFADALGVEVERWKNLKTFHIPAGITRESYLGAMKAGKAEANISGNTDRRKVAASFTGLRRSIESNDSLAKELRLGDWEHYRGD